MMELSHLLGASSTLAGRLHCLGSRSRTCSDVVKKSRSLHREVAAITYSVQHWLTTALTVLRGMKLGAVGS